MTVWNVPNLYQVDLTTYILTITRPNAITRYKIFISCRCDASVEISEKDKIVIVKKSPNWQHSSVSCTAAECPTKVIYR